MSVFLIFSFSSPFPTSPFRKYDFSYLPSDSYSFWIVCLFCWRVLHLCTKKLLVPWTSYLIVLTTQWSKEILGKTWHDSYLLKAEKQKLYLRSSCWVSKSKECLWFVLEAETLSGLCRSKTHSTLWQVSKCFY